MNRYWSRIIVTVALLGGVAFMVNDLRLVQQHLPRLFRVQPQGIMGTTCSLTVVATSAEMEKVKLALQSAENALRQVEAQMSTHLEASMVSRINQAAAGEKVELTPELLTLLRKSKRLAQETDGAFDVTCRPMLQVWKQAGQQGRLPNESELDEARTHSGWAGFAFEENAIVKVRKGAQIDLGGIAKGYGIDRAAEAIRRGGFENFLVEVGGDIRCGGMQPDGRPWLVAVQNPFYAFAIGEVALNEAAVCTSGNYQRFVEIDGKRYSHILDPRSGYPAEMTPSVTVIAPDTTTADVWATALSVLGVEGLSRLPEGVEALIVMGTDDGNYSLAATGGMTDWLKQGSVSHSIRVYSRSGDASAASPSVQP